MILAGIDEAGLGPALGPFCVACTALRVPSRIDPDAPWDKLAAAVSRHKERVRNRLTVADSKDVFQKGATAALEKTVLPFWSAGTICGGGLATDGKAPLPGSREELLASLGADETTDELKQIPWYKDAVWAIPGSAVREPFEINLNMLREAANAANVMILPLRMRVLTASMLNRAFATGKNKSEVALAEVGRHIRHLASSYPGEAIDLVVDKQGGRNFYAPFLTDLFQGAWIQTVRESASLSEYVIPDGSREIRIRFQPKADRDAFCVALASMAAKYIRERLMEDLNAWFVRQLPGLQPTAGYHGDAPRFLEEIQPIIAKHAIPTSQLVRER